MLAYGITWVNAMDCRFEDNQVGFRFNAEGTVVTHTQYANNEFFHNGTAVLLKSVPAESPLSFPGSVFEDNDTDIDNRCLKRGPIRIGWVLFCATGIAGAYCR